MASFYAENAENIKQKIIFSQIKIKNIGIIKAQNVRNVRVLESKNIWRTKEVNDLPNHARILVNGCKSRISRGKAKYQTLEFNISKEFILELYKRQNGKCAISGLEMTYIEGSGRHLKNMSIDPTKGYTEDNVQLVCAQVNMMKSDMSLEELYTFCEAILKNK